METMHRREGPATLGRSTMGAAAAALRERREAARSERLARLLHERPDLAGVHQPADWAVEAVRWGA